MKNESVVTLKTDANCAWIAVLDPASGKRGRYTVYRLYLWAGKRADIIGRELDLRAARKRVTFFQRQPGGKSASAKIEASRPSFDHTCDWREAALKLAKCVVATIQTDGKIGMGSGMVLKMVEGKRTLERWDKVFIEALDFIGVELVDKAPKKPKPRK